MNEQEINVSLDGQLQRIPAATPLEHLLTQLSLAPESVATALNGQFVARSARAAALLKDGDQVLLFKPIVGG
ncbi:sulfur carrier protein ThiS [Roseateles oligotrophus]|uniref:Sulfur carrier protein ThiS n=1 Tax=Roseateles oligotrophus TaxID=1769250 RepID=A0ABT2YI87_9BURK|nr:sulfur carrier protein ThiS [Roseateles oligotrophus]MCV2369800.1 sulfur carrier protein ThiS [Roseateles oligotrophus]